MGEHEDHNTGRYGFFRDELMKWCEQNGVDYVLGMGRNSRLMKKVKKQVRGAHIEYVETKRPSRRFVSFMYSTRGSWSSKPQGSVQG